MSINVFFAVAISDNNVAMAKLIAQFNNLKIYPMLCVLKHSNLLEHFKGFQTIFIENKMVTKIWMKLIPQNSHC